jgi:hypothetical protein
MAIEVLGGKGHTYSYWHDFEVIFFTDQRQIYCEVGILGYIQKIGNTKQGHMDPKK